MSQSQSAALQRGRLTVAIVTATLFLGVAIAWPSSAHASGKKLKRFKSTSGGYQVSIPESWHAKEIPGDAHYQGFLSREPVDKPGDLYLYGVSIVRLRDFRDAFTFQATTPAAMALEYANKLASQKEGAQGQSAVIGFPGSVRGLDSWNFRITKYGGTDECLNMWLLVGLKGQEWVHALWELPCKEREANEDQLWDMAESFVVSSKWGK